MRRSSFIPAALALLLLPWSSTASAQSRVVVLRLDASAEPVCASVEQALTGYSFVADPGYAAASQRQGLDPASDPAYAALLPAIGAALAVVPLSSDGMVLTVEYRDGRNGASLGTINVPLEGGAIGWAGARVLGRETQRRMGAGQAPADSGSVAPSGDVAPDEVEPGDGVALEANVTLSAGVGMRDVSWPAAPSEEKLALGGFPALGVEGAIAIVPSPGFAFGPRFAYQSSYGHEIDEAHVAGPKRTMAIRAHRFEAALVPEVRLGDTHRFRIAFVLGIGVRNLRPEVHYVETPGYSLAGPMARIDFRIPFGDDAVALTLGPEFQWLAVVGKELQRHDVGSSGIAFGGEAGLEVKLWDGGRGVLRYREAHALLSGQGGESATDVERFITLGVRWELER